MTPARDPPAADPHAREARDCLAFLAALEIACSYARPAPLDGRDAVMLRRAAECIRRLEGEREARR